LREDLYLPWGVMGPADLAPLRRAVSFWKSVRFLGMSKPVWLPFVLWREDLGRRGYKKCKLLWGMRL